MIARFRAWLRRVLELDRDSLPYDWRREDPDLRHNGGHVRDVRPVARYPEASSLKGRRS